MSFGLIALDVVLRIGLIEKRDAKKWTNKADTDQTQTQFHTKSISPSTTEDMEKQGARDVVPVEKGTTSSATATNLASTKNRVVETPQVEESRSSYAPIFSLLKSPAYLPLYLAVSSSRPCFRPSIRYFPCTSTLSSAGGLLAQA